MTTAFINKINPAKAYTRNNDGKLCKWEVTIGPDQFGTYNTKKEAEADCVKHGVVFWK